MYKTLDSLVKTKELKSFIKENEQEIKQSTYEGWVFDFEKRFENNYSFLFPYINSIIEVFGKKDKLIKNIISSILSKTIYHGFMYLILIYLIGHFVPDSSLLDISYINILLFILSFNTLYSLFYYHGIVNFALLVVKKSLQKREKDLLFLKGNNLLVTILIFNISFILFIHDYSIDIVLLMLLPLFFAVIDIHQKVKLYKDSINSIEILFIIYILLEKNNQIDLFHENFKQQIKIIDIVERVIKKGEVIIKHDE